MAFERFSARARKVMALANQEGHRYRHGYIGPEHILLGLIKEGSGVAANVLKNLNVDLYEVRPEVEKIVKPGIDIVTTDKLPQTPLGKKVIEYAIEEARHLNHNYVGTEHLLLGLLREQEGVAAVVLHNLGVNLDTARKGVMALLGMGKDGSIESGAYVLPSGVLQPQVVGLAEGQTFDVFGLLTRMILTRAQTAGAITLFEQSGNPGKGVPMHVHTQEDEYFRVLEGQVRFRIADNVFVADVGTTLLGPRYIPHEWFITGDTPGKVLIATTPGTVFEAMLLNLSKLPPGPPDMAKVAEICALAGVTFAG